MLTHSETLSQNPCPPGNVQPFNFPLGATVLGIRHLGLSGWQTAECLAIENELHAWQHAGIVDREGPEKDVKTWALRLKATLDRARRLAESYSEALLQIYPDRSLKLGDALGVPENSVSVKQEKCRALRRGSRFTSGVERGPETLR